ncbi:MAG TPA: peptidase [Gammaproteobacteria bacterium]|nr:MAG: peptidase [OM182 bacterium]HAL43019.1 peptidase [Gammaproteobacteria bacterium]HBK18541.1 peptidase [Gammaproteobacteria bacterium]|tara:strand:- start:5469 stop:6218 length:750 start_codon:yes stop_codon:yes gene_type:complete
MTYCLAIALEEGLVFCSDSRTNAGADRVSTYSKMHKFTFPGDRMIVLLSAGNLATSQAVVAQMRRDIIDKDTSTLLTSSHLSDVAAYLGGLLAAERVKYETTAGPDAGLDASASLILGGQIQGQPAELFLIYPEGNYIAPSQSHPYLQIGETKYGKPILDRIISYDTPVETAMRCAIVSMDSTLRSNATVGPPIECLFYRRDSIAKEEIYLELDGNHRYLEATRESWDSNIKMAVDQLPSFFSEFSEPE